MWNWISFFVGASLGVICMGVLCNMINSEAYYYKEEEIDDSVQRAGGYE